MTPLERRTRIRAVSKKRVKQGRIYTKKRKVFLEANPLCAAAPWHELMDTECDGIATTIQHKQGRIGDLYLDESHWIGLSMPCHCWVNAFPALAVQYGLAELRVGVA